MANIMLSNNNIRLHCSSALLVCPTIIFQQSAPLLLLAALVSGVALVSLLHTVVRQQPQPQQAHCKDSSTRDSTATF